MEVDSPSSAQAKPRLAWLLGRDRDMRIRLQRTLWSIFMFMSCAVLTQYGIRVNVVDPDQGHLMMVLLTLDSVISYTAIRSGWSLRFKDPALTLPHVLVAETLVCFAYAMSKQAHGSMLVLFAVVLFFGVFHMDDRSAKVSGTYVLVMVGLTMLYKVNTDPVHYPVDLEVINFCFMASAVPIMAYLSTQFSGMRRRLKQQKQDLADALTRMEAMATQDELTGLINRRKFLSLLEHFQHVVKRSNAELWVAMIDLDHFKQINDTWGHGVGDAVLKSFAVQAKRALRDADVVARWGGEEFIVALLEKPGGDPKAGIERLRATLADLPISDKVPSLRIGFSAGLTRCQPGEPVESTLHRADEALYEAKANGRGRTVVVDLQIRSVAHASATAPAPAPV